MVMDSMENKFSLVLSFFPFKVYFVSLRFRNYSSYLAMVCIRNADSRKMDTKQFSPPPNIFGWSFFLEINLKGFTQSPLLHF